MYDAIIVGARVAGAPTAMLLAKQGHRVLVVDRATFPSDIMSTHYIHQSGVARLKRWGLLDAVVATNCPPMRGIQLSIGPLVLHGEPPPVGEADVAYCPRRSHLDKILVDAARAAGAEVREGFSVRELITENGTVVGLRGRDADGNEVEERARVVIGADGKNSFVARQVGAPAYEEIPALEAIYYSYFSGIDCKGVEQYFGPECMAITFPTNDGLAVIAAGVPAARFDDYRRDIEGTFYGVCDMFPALGQRVRNAKRMERWEGTVDIANYFRVPFGPGWALVGDAGYHRDPITGLGISDAFRDAELLAQGLHRVFSGEATFEEAMGEYQAARDAQAMPLYQLTAMLGSLQPPPPDVFEMIASLPGNQEDTDRFLGLLAGSTDFATFMAPENVGRIIGAARERSAATA